MRTTRDEGEKTTGSEHAMAWAERKYDDDDGGARGAWGGVRRALSRIFVEGDNFYAWALPLFTAFGIRVRIHLFFIILIVAELVGSIPRDSLGIGYTLLWISILFVLVLLHEFGHCFACRWVRGDADQILMWPLGGLAFAVPPREWRASFITTAGGPLVNVAIIPVSTAALLAAGGGIDSVLFNPFDPSGALSRLQFTSWSTVGLWWFHYVNLALLAFNVLLPMFPMDGGRMMQELLWSRLGYRRSMQIAVNTGLVMAVVVGVFALTGDQMRLFGLAVFCGFTCWMERRNLQFLDDPALPGYDFDRGHRGMPGASDDDREAVKAGAQSRREARAREREQRDRDEVDRILAKIAQSGLNSLSRTERTTLRKATERGRTRA